MTRGTFYLITVDGKIWMSPEFNGDMYIEHGHGTDAITVLETARINKTTTIADFKELIKTFNKEHHNYHDIPENKWLVKHDDALKTLMRERCSDYNYVLDLTQNKVRVFGFTEEITNDEEVQSIIRSVDAGGYQSFTIDVPGDLAKKLAEEAKKNNMTVDEFASKLVQDAIDNGTFNNIVLKSLTSTADSILD